MNSLTIQPIGQVSLQDSKIKNIASITPLELQSNSTDIVKALYLSPVMKLDPKTNVMLFIYRDTETGEVKQQFPNAKSIEKYINGKAEISKADETDKPSVSADETTKKQNSMSLEI